MSSLWQQIKNLFQAAEESSPSQPVLKSELKRSQAEKVDYESWKNGLAKRRLLDWLHAEYANYLINPDEVDLNIDFLNIRTTRGFAIHFHKLDYSLRDITHFFDLLKELLRNVGYRTYTSDSRTYNRPKWVEQLDRHYLKPPIVSRESGEKIKQTFGNVTIELLFRNDEPYQLKFSATSYNDRNYEKAEGFDDLMGVLR